MQHGPDPYARALADLDALLARRDQEIEAWVIEAARHVDRMRTAGRTLIAAARVALGDQITADTRQRIHVAIAHFEEAAK